MHLRSFQPHDTLVAAAEEVLKILKSDSIREMNKRKEVEELIYRQADERYALLVNLSKKITDFDLTIEDAQEVRVFFCSNYAN